MGTTLSTDRDPALNGASTFSSLLGTTAPTVTASVTREKSRSTSKDSQCSLPTEPADERDPAVKLDHPSVASAATRAASDLRDCAYRVVHGGAWSSVSTAQHTGQACTAHRTGMSMKVTGRQRRARTARIGREHLRGQQARRKRVRAKAHGRGWRRQRDEHQEVSRFLRVHERIHGRRFSKIIKQLKRMRKGVVGGGL